jgi:hypothetical protein
VYETVGIGSGNGHDQRTLRKSIGELLNGFRTAPGVQRDHHIGILASIVGGDLNPVTQ